MADLDPRVRAIAQVIWDAENGDGAYDRAMRQIPETMKMPGLVLNITASKCLSALREAIPGLDALIAGTGVVVPREPTEAMFFDPDEVCVNMGQSPWEAFCKIYRAMIEAAKDTRHD